MVLETAKQQREFAEGGLYDFSSTVLLQANAEQVRLDPPRLPNAITYDRRLVNMTPAEARRLASLPVRRTTVVGWRRKVTLTYGFQFNLFKSVAKAYLDLWRLTRKKSQRGVESYYFYARDKDNPARSTVLTSLNAVDLWLSKAQSPRVSMAILGPTVVYRRKLIYNPAGKSYNESEGRILERRAGVLSRRARSSVDRIIGFNESDAGIRFSASKAGRVLVQFRIQQALHRIVVRRNKARFRSEGVWISYGYVPSRDPLPGDPRTGEKYGQGPHGNIPALYIGGSLRR